MGVLATLTCLETRVCKVRQATEEGQNHGIEKELDTSQGPQFPQSKERGGQVRITVSKHLGVKHTHNLCTYILLPPMHFLRCLREHA